VGVTGVREAVLVQRRGLPFGIVGDFDVFIDLPAHIRGAHLSRSNEVVNNAIWGTLDAKLWQLKAREKPADDIADLCIRMARDLLDRHEYASRSEVHFRGEYWLPKETPGRSAAVQEVYGLHAYAKAERDVSGTVCTRKGVGVEVSGITTCPCAQNEFRKWAIDKLQGQLSREQMQVVLSEIPLPTHMQRAQASVLFETTEHCKVDIEALVTLVESSMSAETFEILKREEELQVVLKAFSNPRFVEDVVRQIAQAALREFAFLPDDTVMVASIVSQESIHKHNALAEIASSFGELREQNGLIVDEEGAGSGSTMENAL